jgi:hypothetical protein
MSVLARKKARYRARIAAGQFYIGGWFPRHQLEDWVTHEAKTLPPLSEPNDLSLRTAVCLAIDRLIVPRDTDVDRDG